MTDNHPSLESRVEHLAAQVEALILKVDALSEKIALFSARPAMNGAASRDADFPDPSEALLSWVGRSLLLQRLSTICFLLVVALVLRTVTDNGMVNLQLGYIIGMSYAAALMFMGWRRYRRANPLAPIFTVCGTILMFTIVVETHAHFDALPTINVAWAFVLVQYVVSAMGGSKIMLGAIGVIAGTGHLTVAMWLAGRDPKGARGTNAFLFAGSVLLALALPLATGSILLSLPMLAAVAFWAAVMSAKWHSGSVRLTSYLLQIYATVALVVVLLGWETIPSFLASAVSAGGIACLGLMQYRWCRSRKPPEESAFFSRIDKGDFSAVAIFLAAIMRAFFLLQVIAHRLLAMTLAPARPEQRPALQPVGHHQYIRHRADVLCPGIPQQGGAQRGNPGDGDRRRQCFPVRPHQSARNAAGNQRIVLRPGHGRGIGHPGALAASIAAGAG
ncbi:MAG: hypothetical protein KJ814_02990 [Proteobacteria bacterium]|nr:hypothetical protein [Pseudomonadota bacterium]